jgi:prevent-host-death family protein
MDNIISQRELRNDSAAVLREVQAGRRLTVTRNGVPVAELRPVSAGRFVARSVIAAAIPFGPAVDGVAFRTDLDAIVDQAVDG